MTNRMNQLFAPIWQRLTSQFGQRDSAFKIIETLRAEIGKDASLAGLSKYPGWTAYHNKAMLAVHQIENEIIGFCEDPVANQWKIRERKATIRAILGLLAIPETTNRLFEDKLKQLESELKTIRETTDQSPLNLFYWRQTTQTGDGLS